MDSATKMLAMKVCSVVALALTSVKGKGRSQGDWEDTFLPVIMTGLSSDRMGALD